MVTGAFISNDGVLVAERMKLTHNMIAYVVLPPQFVLDHAYSGSCLLVFYCYFTIFYLWYLNASMFVLGMLQAGFMVQAMIHPSMLGWCWTDFVS